MVLNKTDIKIKEILEYLAEKGTTKSKDLIKKFPKFEELKNRYDLVIFIGYTNQNVKDSGYFIRLEGLKRLEQYKLREISEEQNKIAKDQTKILSKQQDTFVQQDKTNFKVFIATMCLVLITGCLIWASYIIADSNEELIKSFTPSKFPDLVFYLTGYTSPIPEFSNNQIKGTEPPHVSFCGANIGRMPSGNLSIGPAYYPNKENLFGLRFGDHGQIHDLKQSEFKCIDMYIQSKECENKEESEGDYDIKKGNYTVYVSISCQNCEHEQKEKIEPFEIRII